MPKKKKPKTKTVKPVLKVFCEGEKTEPLYLKGYIEHFHSGKRNLIVIEKTDKNTPVQLVQEAIDTKHANDIDDDIWVVYDREAESKYSHQLHHKARSQAMANSINIACSNVCFELWILLHFQYTTQSFNSCAELVKSQIFRKHMQSIGVNQYDKANSMLFDKLKERIEEAKTNSNRLKRSAISSSEPGKNAPHYLNPYTDVQDLLEAMDDFIKRH